MTEAHTHETCDLESTREITPQELAAVAGGNHHVLVALHIAKMYAAKPSVFELKPFGG